MFIYFFALSLRVEKAILTFCTRFRCPLGGQFQSRLFSYTDIINHKNKTALNKFTLTLLSAATLLCGTGVSYALAPKGFDISKMIYKAKNGSDAFKSERMKRIESTNALLEAGKPSRFASTLAAPADDSDIVTTPSQEFGNRDLWGEMDAPNGETWFYSGKIEYKKNVVNEYFTEMLPQSFSIEIFDQDMNLVGTISDKLEIKADEARVRAVEVLPVISRNYFNTDDKVEVAVAVTVNPLPWGIRPYTYIYSIGNPKDSEGNDEPIQVYNHFISDVLDASTDGNENLFMTVVSEGNDSGVTEEDLGQEGAYWKYQLGNYMKAVTYAKADANGQLKPVFEKRITYYQYQGDQQDTPPLMSYVQNGKPCIVFPHYEELFYNKFDSMDEDITQRLPNKLVIEIYELDEAAGQFKLAQTTKIDVVRPEIDGIIASYYGIGLFSYTGDVAYGDDGLASFIVTRSDYMASSDSFANSYFIYNADGTLRCPLFENAASHQRLSDIEGFDPMEMFAELDAQGYWFNFVNMRTFQTELRLFQGLIDEDSDDPDYMMANMDRIKVGDTFMYAVEMRVPEYDDIEDTNFMRVAWITREGKLDHMDYINIGNLVNYASLYMTNMTLDENYFHKGPEREYMMLIKRANADDASSEEQLLVAQATSENYPAGRELLLLGPDPEYGVLDFIQPYPTYLSVRYKKTVDGLDKAYTRYYDMPLNKTAGIVDAVAGELPFAFDGTNVTLDGAFIEVYNLQGIRVAAATGSVSLQGMTPGVYMVRAAGHTAKVAVK